MFVSNQRAFTPNTSLLASRYFFINKDNKIKINKSNIYYEDYTSLEN